MKPLHALPALLLLAITACAPTPPPPARVVGQLQAVPGLNPSASGKPLPLRVRMYELKAPGTFQNADFFSLWDKAQGTLGADLTGSEEWVVQPGSTLTLDRQLDPATRHVGVIAAYRDINGSTWRKLVAVPPNQTTRLSIQLGATALNVSAGP